MVANSSQLLLTGYEHWDVNCVIIVLTLTIKLPDFIKACLFETSVNGLKFNSV